VPPRLMVVSCYPSPCPGLILAGLPSSLGREAALCARSGKGRLAAVASPCLATTSACPAPPWSRRQVDLQTLGTNTAAAELRMIGNNPSTAP